MCVKPKLFFRFWTLINARITSKRHNLCPDGTILSQAANTVVDNHPSPTAGNTRTLHIKKNSQSEWSAQHSVKPGSQALLSLWLWRSKDALCLLTALLPVAPAVYTIRSAFLKLYNGQTYRQ